MGQRLYFDEEMLQDHKRLVEQLNMAAGTIAELASRLARAEGKQAKPSENIQSTGNLIRGIIPDLTKTGIVEGEYINPTMTVDDRGRIRLIESGVGGGAGLQGIGFIKTIAAAGVESVVIPNIGTSNYVIDGYVLTAAGDKIVAVPHIPPYTADSRTPTGFDVDVQAAGTLYGTVYPITGAIGFSRSVAVAGVETFTFADIGTTNYVVSGYVLTADGYIVVAIPRVPPLTDSRQTTQFQLEALASGVLYACLLVA